MVEWMQTGTMVTSVMRGISLFHVRLGPSCERFKGRCDPSLPPTLQVKGYSVCGLESSNISKKIGFRDVARHCGGIRRKRQWEDYVACSP